MELAGRIALVMDRLAPQWRSVPGIVAVSGGADSVALLRLLAPLSLGGRGAGGEGDTKFIVAHVNHQLRGGESDADEAFVIRLAERWNLEVRTERIPVPSGNLESEARKSRYAFFVKVAAETNAGWIATAHTLDDQAETVLHRLIRGTGIQGLRGIDSRRAGLRQRPESEQQELRALTQPGSTVIRPLLGIRRNELREFLHSIDQSHREDSSNLDLRFTRNRIRHELLPMLDSFNPRIAEVLNRLSQQAAELHENAEIETAMRLREVELPRAGGMLIFDTGKLESLTEPQRRGVLRMAWQREGWPEQGMTFAHWIRLAKLESCDFPGGIRVKKIGNVFQLGKQSSPHDTGEKTR